MSTHKITKSLVDRAQLPESGQVFYRDSILKGFALRVTSGGSKAFILEKRINKKLKRITLGRYPEITTEMARKEALKYLGEIATGEDPIANRQQSQAQQMTLDDVWQDYKRVKSNLRPNTYKQYKMFFNGPLADWMRERLTEIDKDMVLDKHKNLLATHSPSYANGALRLVSALFEFAKFQYEDVNGKSLFPVNPIDRMGHLKAWAKEPRRKTIIKPSQLAHWYNSVRTFKAQAFSQGRQVFSDYIVFVLLTGLRKNEAASLKWANVDFDEQTFLVPDTKNKEPLVLPMSDIVLALLKRLAQEKQNEYVFPSKRSGYLKNTEKQLREFKELSELYFSIHDLRRTYITVAESLDISGYAIKKLINHRSGNDVTMGYIISNHDRLREPMQRISDYFKEKCAMHLEDYE
jgi:integrase